MATVVYWSSSWASAGDGYDLKSGDSHKWGVGVFRYGDVISVTAFPVIGDPLVTRNLAIRNLRSETNPDGLLFLFEVANVGNSSVPGYSVNLAVFNK